MMPVVLEIGAIHIYGYGLMLGLAFLMGTWMLALGLRRRDVDPSLAYTITALAIVFGVYGSKVLWLLEHWGALLADPLEVALNPGMTFYGGLVMGTAAIFLYVRSRRVGFASVLDAAAPALMIAYGIGRLGCHLAGDGDYGMPTTLPWGTDYSHGFVPPSRALAIFPDIAARYPGGVVPDNTLLHPTPVYEFLLGVLGCAILRRLDRRQPPGRLFVVYLMLSSTFRFAVEFLRLNPRVALGLTDAQLVSGALFVVALAGSVYLGRRRRRTRREPRRPSLVFGGDVVRGGVPVRHPLVLAALGGLLLCVEIGCVSKQSVTDLTQATQLRTSSAHLTGVRFLPSFVRDSTMRLPPSSTNLYWLLPGETVTVGWEDLDVTVDLGRGPSECHLCQAQVAADHHMVICNDPLVDRYVGLLAVEEIGVVVNQVGGPRVDHQALGPFPYQTACIDPSNPDVAPRASRVVAPLTPPTFTVMRSGQWAASTVTNLQGLATSAVAYALPSDFVAVLPTPGVPTSMLWVVPQGGRLTMDPRKMQRFDATHWQWSVPVTTDANGRIWWDENFAPGLAVGYIRIYKGKIVTDDPFFPDPYLSITQVVPRRIRVYDPFDPNVRNPLASDAFFCFADPNASTRDGDFNLTRCRSGSTGPSRRLVTPGYDPARTTLNQNERQNMTRAPMTWMAEFDPATFPAPTLDVAAGEELYIEFTLGDVAGIP